MASSKTAPEHAFATLVEEAQRHPWKGPVVETTAPVGGTDGWAPFWGWRNMHWWVGKAGVRRVHVISHTLRQVAASALLQKSAGRYSYNVVARRFHVNFASGRGSERRVCASHASSWRGAPPPPPRTRPRTQCKVPVSVAVAYTYFRIYESHPLVPMHTPWRSQPRSCV